MQTLTAISPTRHHFNATQIVVGVPGCILALVVGAAAATSYGVFVAAALACSVLFAVAAALYVRDPILALIWLWLFEIFNAPISAVFGYTSSTGEAIRQGDEILVLLFFGLTIWRTVRIKASLAPLQIIIIPAAGVALFGLLGAVIHGVPLVVTLLGAWLGL